MSFFKAVICTAISFALVSSFIATQATAQSDNSDKKGKKDEEIRKELRELRQGQEDLRRELNELKQLLLAMQPPRRPAPLARRSRTSPGAPSA